MVQSPTAGVTAQAQVTIGHWTDHSGRWTQTLGLAIRRMKAQIRKVQLRETCFRLVDPLCYQEAWNPKRLQNRWNCLKLKSRFVSEIILTLFAKLSLSLMNFTKVFLVRKNLQSLLERKKRQILITPCLRSSSRCVQKECQLESLTVTFVNGLDQALNRVKTFILDMILRKILNTNLTCKRIKKSTPNLRKKFHK